MRYAVLLAIGLFWIVTTAIDDAAAATNSQALHRVDLLHNGVMEGRAPGADIQRQGTIDLLGGSLGNGDFEDALGDPDPEGWTSVDRTGGAGDFALIRTSLSDIDPGRSNFSPQFTFVDDGVVVPGTGGTPCITWCYGPEGWVVNPEGGLLGSDFGIHNEIRSPVIDWNAADEYAGGRLSFEVFVHLPHFAENPDIYFYWQIRSTSSGDPADLDSAPWTGDNLLYFGSQPEYRQFEVDVTPYLVTGRTYVQVALGVIDFNLNDGIDATPAPYFDNVLLEAYEPMGPVMIAQASLLAQDAFPEHGIIDYDVLGSNNVRFDMASNIAPPEHLRNDPGDSVTCTIVVARPGAELDRPPRLYYKLQPNPLFTVIHRTAGLPDDGFVEGDSCRTPAGEAIPNRFFFDLPDSGFLFPGDELRYYIEARDNQRDVLAATLPADTTGFANFSITSTYPGEFEVRALPTLMSSFPGDHPPILLVNDAAGRGNEDEWSTALANLGYLPSVNYDLYEVNEPAAGVGNGIGGRATTIQLEGYETILYTSGDLDLFTLSDGDYDGDPSDDIGVLDNWLLLGEKSLLVCGDNLATDLERSGPAGAFFLQTRLGLSWNSENVSYFIGNQTSPLVRTEVGNSVVQQIDTWLLDGVDQPMRNFDAVRPFGNAERLAEFLAPDGSPGQYIYSAATLLENTDDQSRVVSLPYDLARITHDLTISSPFPSAYRTKVLEDILLYFGHVGMLPEGVPHPDSSFATTTALVPVSVFSLPDRGGYGPQYAFAFGGNITDATITVTLRDAFGAPVVGYPAEDVWLASEDDGLAYCPGGATSDYNTDTLGRTSFSQPLAAGGHSDPAVGAVVWVAEAPLNQAPLPISFNSVDINGDGNVNPSDVGVFTQDFYGSYAYRSDFNWDGIYNISDLILLTLSNGRACDSYSEPLPVPGPPPAATIGLFFDTGGSQNSAQIDPGLPFEVYMVLTPQAATTVGGVAFSLPLDPAVLYLGSDFSSTWGDLGSGLEGIIGHCPAVPAGNSIVVATINLLLTQAVSTELQLGDHPTYGGLAYGNCSGQLTTDVTNVGPAYINPSQGVITIDPEPDEINAPWQLVGNLGSNFADAGDTTLTNMAADTYTLTWGEVEGWFPPSPNPDVQVLDLDGSITFTGQYVTPLPNLLSIADVPNDQGRYVRLIWERSIFDAPDSEVEITGYGVYRRQDEFLAKAAAADQQTAGDDDLKRLAGWDFITMVPAHGDDIYQCVSPTLCDSTLDGICWSVFFLRTMTPDQFTFWDTPPDSGYSIDNLVPGVPLDLHIAYAAEGNDVSWAQNIDPDIWHYNVYRADWDDCVFPGGDPVAEVPTTSWTDDLNGVPGSAWDYCYFVTAEDFAGNESDPTDWDQAVVTGAASPVLPTRLALHPCYPNPFNATTQIRYDLPDPALVSLSIYDVSGRQIWRNSRGHLPAGRYEEIWTGRDVAGSVVAAGVYFVQLKAGNFVQTQRVTMVK